MEGIALNVVGGKGNLLRRKGPEIAIFGEDKYEEPVEQARKNRPVPRDRQVFLGGGEVRYSQARKNQVSPMAGGTLP